MTNALAFWVILGMLYVSPNASPVPEETPGISLCPKTAIGFVAVNQDGDIEVGGDNFTDDV